MNYTLIMKTGQSALVAIGPVAIEYQAAMLRDEIETNSDWTELGIARVLTEVADSYLNFQVVALREMEERTLLSVVPDVLATVPFFDSDLFDLAGLVRLGEQIWE